MIQYIDAIVARLDALETALHRVTLERDALKADLEAFVAEAERPLAQFEREFAE